MSVNRKMRAKANNQAAREKRNRKPCPLSGKFIQTHGDTCDTCGDKLAAAVLVEVVPVTELDVPRDKRELN